MAESRGYPEAIVTLLTPDRVPALGPGSPLPAIRSRLSAFDPFHDLGPIRNRDAALAVHAGLWLWHDYLDESHTISQSLETAEGSFWHAIMHRREPDAWNSKYWWRKVGPHPVLNQLRQQSPTVGYDYTSPSEFVDFCERVRGKNTPEELLAQQVQRLEWQLLFDHCYHLAIG